MKNQPTPTSYTDASDILGGRESRKIAGNTYLERLNAGTIGVRLHRTYVVLFHNSDVLQISSGGWRTVTTKERINRYLPAGFRVFQEDFVWYIKTPDNEWKNATPFEDGYVVDPRAHKVQA